MRLKDKTALVTGAASGNGRAIATLFAQEGAKVVLADINKEGVEQVTADLQQKGCEVLSVVIDVTKESDHFRKKCFRRLYFDAFSRTV